MSLQGTAVHSAIYSHIYELRELALLRAILPPAPSARESGTPASEVVIRHRGQTASIDLGTIN